MCNTENLDEDKGSERTTGHQFEGLPGWDTVKPGGLFIVTSERPGEDTCQSVPEGGMLMYRPLYRSVWHRVYVKPEAAPVDNRTRRMERPHNCDCPDCMTDRYEAEKAAKEPDAFEEVSSR